MDCEMCGREKAELKVSVEGTSLSLCQACSRYGKTVGTLASPRVDSKKTDENFPKPEETEFVVANFGPLLKQKREKLGMTQEEFGKKIAVKESILHKMETSSYTPGIEEARRIEKLLGVRLIERIETVESVLPPTKKDQLTLGDMIKIKKKN